jgi:hypothetical protein
MMLMASRWYTMLPVSPVSFLVVVELVALVELVCAWHPTRKTGQIECLVCVSMCV